MARSPFQGTFQPNVRPTVTTAPDAVVYINGEQEVVGCPQCTRSFNLNKYITSIQTDLNIDSVPGSATISLSIPRHTIDDFYFDGNPVITAMMEVEIYAKGYYLVEGLPQYYPIFWGIVTEVSDSYSSGEHTVSIQCADILKWWELCVININPAYTAASGQMGRSLTGNVFAQINPFDIIFSLAQYSFGDVVVATGSMNAFVSDSGQRQTFDAALGDMMAYWEKRFARMRSNLVLYGAAGVAVRGESLFSEYSKVPGPSPKSPIAASAVLRANGDEGLIFNPTSSAVSAYKQVPANAGQIDLWQSEYQTKLEIANVCKESIGYEFYMDVTGDIVFKPPFYNLDVLSNKPVSWIQDIDIINWEFSESESEVVTQLSLIGNYGGTVDYGLPQEVTPASSVTDYHLLRKYGWRSRPYNAEYTTSPHLMFLHGLDVLDRINSKRYRGSVTIPYRPELRLGFPIYIAPKDQIWYVNGISHSISFGGQATTTLQLTAKRQKFVAPKGMGTLRLDTYNKQEVDSNDKNGEPKTFQFNGRNLTDGAVFSLDVSGASFVPPDSTSLSENSGAGSPLDPLILRHPKTGRLVGYPNVVMAYTRPFDPSDAGPQMGEKNISKPNPNIDKQLAAKIGANQKAQRDHIQGIYTSNLQDYLTDKYLNNRYQYGLNSAGVFVYAHDVTGHGVVSEAFLIDHTKLKVKPQSAGSTNFAAKSVLIRPISDERGFEVIGHFQYGRRVLLRDGRLIMNAPNERAQIDIQLSLSGGLSEMLTAQSQGLTTVSTGYQDPARTLANMTMDDRETAAVPDMAAPKFVNVGDNFVSTATLDSQEKKGSPNSVEATQLSRALTLAELGVKNETSAVDEDCVCITGRADLAFMNFDYQVKALSNTSTEDTSGLNTQGSLDIGVRGQPINTGAIPQAKNNVDFNQATVNSLETTIGEKLFSPPPPDASPKVVAAYKKDIADLNAQLDAANAKLADSQSTLEEISSQYTNNGSPLIRAGEELISKVDQFLTKLYIALDEPHQQFESAIRGDLLPGSPGTSGLSASQVNPPSEFAPPFSAPNRFELGDPKAAAGAIQSNAGDIAKAWSTFGNSLRSDAEKKSLSTQIGQDSSSIARLTKTRDQLVAQKNSSVVVIGVDIDNQISTLNSEIAKLQQQVANNQAKLNEL